MKTLKELSRMIAWLVVAGFLFFSGLYFYDSVREYRQEKFSFDREISELQAQIKAQDAKILELQELVKQQNTIPVDKNTVSVNVNPITLSVFICIGVIIIIQLSVWVKIFYKEFFKHKKPEKL